MVNDSERKWKYPRGTVIICEDCEAGLGILLFSSDWVEEMLGGIIAFFDRLRDWF